MKSFYTIICLLLSVIFYAQESFSIKWNSYTTYNFGTEIKQLPHFECNGLKTKASFEKNNIFMNFKYSKGNEVEISNLVWEEINKNELYDIIPNLLNEEEVKSISYQPVNGSKIAFISLNLLKKENNKFKRLVSFTISNANTNNRIYTMREQVGNTENPLANGNFYKIKIDSSGVYKITYQFLQQNGLNPSNINPLNFRIYGNGGIMLPEYNQDTKYASLQENAIQVVGGEDGVWNEEDYALFYAQDTNAYNLYNITNGNGYKRRETRTDRPNHFKNIYDDVAYYFINFDLGRGKRIQEIDISLPSEMITKYDAYQFIDKDEINLLKLGRTWVESNPFINTKNITFTTQNSLNPEDRVTYRTRVIGYNSQGNSITYNINNQNNTTSVITNTDYFPSLFFGSLTGISSNTITINMIPNISNNPNGSFYFDYAEIQYKQPLSFNGKQMNFRDFSLESGSNTKYGFSISNASTLEQVWDITDITNVKKTVNKGSSNEYKFAYITDDPYFNNEFVAFNTANTYEPTYVGKIENQNLRGLQNIDYLIITQPHMISEANRLANYHTIKNNFNTAVVDINKIYNEFSSGSKDLTAIRDFITYLNTPNGTLKYVLLLGDTSFDYKDVYANNDNIVFSYQSEESGGFSNSFVMDDYIVMTSPQTTSFITNIMPDIPIGRLPASNVTEAKEMIDKTLAYYNALPGQSSPFGVWRLNLDFVVDDDKDGGIPFHTVMNNTITNVFEEPTDKPEYNVKKLYSDAFNAENSAGGQRYPQVNQAITNDIGNSLFIFYFGHGGPYGWAQERVLTSNEINTFNNFSSVYSRFPLVSTITCEFALWDNPDVFSAGEQVIKKSNGGAATIITSSRALRVSYGTSFTDDFIKKLFELNTDNDFKTLGNSYLEARQEFGTHVDHFKVNFLGDPAMKLSRPKKLIEFDEIETPTPDMIRALDFVTIRGHINKEDGTLDSEFNGKIVINIFDKLLNKSTLNNDGNLTPTLNYTEEEGAIVKTSGNVVNGIFEVQFYVPNDINYTPGDGRILAYADNGEKDVFNNINYRIGDINPDGLNDNEPPKVKLFMNNTNFVNGGITNKTPLLLACLTDDTGINATGAGIGHDITVYLDGEIINTTVLNDFYNPGEGNGCVASSLEEYQKGSVTYPFRDLKPGKHTLTFKVWDINNNSTTETLDFIVRDPNEENLVINRLLNWPNPFTDKTYIQFEHNCDDILEVNVQIYTITGKLVRTINQSVTAEPYLEGYRTPVQAIEWDGKDDFGSNVAKGTYIYKVFAKSATNQCKGSAQGIEKMVILK